MGNTINYTCRTLVALKGCSLPWHTGKLTWNLKNLHFQTLLSRVTSWSLRMGTYVHSLQIRCHGRSILINLININGWFVDMYLPFMFTPKANTVPLAGPQNGWFSTPMYPDSCALRSIFRHKRVHSNERIICDDLKGPALSECRPNCTLYTQWTKHNCWVQTASFAQTKCSNDWGCATHTKVQRFAKDVYTHINTPI